MTNIDQKWAQGIRDSVNALILEVERLEALDAANARLISDLRAAVERAKASYSERVAQITAHRACCGNEHDAISKFHGCCVVCGVPFPCEYAGTLPAPSSEKK